MCMLPRMGGLPACASGTPLDDRMIRIGMIRQASAACIHVCVYGPGPGPGLGLPACTTVFALVRTRIRICFHELRWSATAASATRRACSVRLWSVHVHSLTQSHWEGPVRPRPGVNDERLRGHWLTLEAFMISVISPYPVLVAIDNINACM